MFSVVVEREREKGFVLILYFVNYVFKYVSRLINFDNKITCFGGC